MKTLKSLLLAASILVPICSASAKPKEIVETLMGGYVVSPSNVTRLTDIACNTVDKVSHLDLVVPKSQMTSMNQDGWLVVSNDQFEIQIASFETVGNDYIVKGYYITVPGGTHQGVSSFSFELLDRYVKGTFKEFPAKGPCGDDQSRKP